VIDSEYRGKARVVAMGLAMRAFQYSMRNDVRWWIASMTQRLADSFRALDVKPEILREEEPLPRHMEARKALAGYFKRYEGQLGSFAMDLKPASPFKALVKQIRVGMRPRSPSGDPDSRLRRGERDRL
jgi:hypothetical protein